MSQPTPVEALVKRILEGRAPLVLRQAAARGALPLPRTLLTRVYVHLLEDSEGQVRETARANLEALDVEAIGEVLSDPGCVPEILRYFTPRAARDTALAEKLAFHPAVPDDALSVLASEGSASVIDLVLTNQQRLLTCPGLLDRLTVNPALRPDQRGRILDLLDGLVRHEARTSTGVTESDVLSEDEAAEEAARLLNVEVGELFAASEILGADELERAEDPLLRSTFSRIVNLTPGQKAVLAMKGGREERMILARDTNKVVALSVLKNPRLTEEDVEEIAATRNVSEEVLRSLGSSREWAKRYPVALALVRNPRTPPGISVNFVSRLTAQDLRGLCNDKNVPEIVRRMAKRTHELRTQQSSPSYRKK